MRGSIVGPPFSVTRISASIVAYHSGAVCPAFGGLVMQVAVSHSVISLWPFGTRSDPRIWRASFNCASHPCRRRF
jgi:hypothetical protein